MLVQSGSAGARISRALHRKALRVLGPAEAALRRLIVIAARGVEAKPVPKRPPPLAPIPAPKGEGRMAFRLFDPRQRFGQGLRPDFGPKGNPRIHLFGAGPFVPLLQTRAGIISAPPQMSEFSVSALPLRRRLAAFQAALADVPRQALRLARWRARRNILPNPPFRHPLRPGRPPGHRREPSQPVDDVLAECHGLACDLLRPDTS